MSRGWTLALALIGCGRVGFTPAREGVIDAAADATPDAVPQPWSFVTTVVNSIGAPPYDPVPNPIPPLVVAAGELVIVSCDGDILPPLATSFTAAPAVVGFVGKVEGTGGDWPAMGGRNVSSVITWGIGSAAAGSGTSVTITADGIDGTYSDCAASLYRNGTTTPHLVDSKITGAGSTGGGLVHCGPVTAVNGGIALYVSGRWTCSGAPVQGPLELLGMPQGNAYGDVAPTMAGTIDTDLMDCGNSGGWVCATVTLSE